MSGRRFALFAAVALFIMFVAANVTANSWFRSWRLDLTENHLYTLSPGTQHTLDRLSEPVELTLYYSRDSAAHEPELQAYASRVREMLQTFQARSHGSVRFVEIDVKPFSEEEDNAVEAGIQPVRRSQDDDPIYFGLTGANAIDDKRAIAYFDPQREAFLEYEITRLIFELEHPDRTRVALITSLPIDPAAAADPHGAAGQSAFAAEMGRQLTVTKLPQTFSAIPDADVLAIIHPWALSPQQLYAVDQFVLRKGRAFVALDPASLAAQTPPQADPLSPAPALVPPSSNLEPLLSRWGVTMQPNVVLDADRALETQTQDPQTGQVGQAPQPLLFNVPADHLDREDLMTAWLQRGINFGLAGGLTFSEPQGGGVQMVRLARTSGHTMRMPAQQALMHPSPADIMNMWQETGGREETVALRLSGNLQTAFPSGPPAAPAAAPAAGATTAPPPEPPHPTAPQLMRSARPAQIVIVADTDFLSDDFYVDPNSGTTAADNGAFALNAIDILGGSDDLVSLRSRSASARPMDRVDQMERQAQHDIEEQQNRLREQLQATQDRLQDLQTHGRGSGFFTGNLGAELTPEENAEIQRFRGEIKHVRTELRNTEHDVRANIESLKALVMFINIWLAPLLIAGVGLFLFWRRQRRGRARG